MTQVIHFFHSIDTSGWCRAGTTFTKSKLFEIFLKNSKKVESQTLCTGGVQLQEVSYDVKQTFSILHAYSFDTIFGHSCKTTLSKV